MVERQGWTHSGGHGSLGDAARDKARSCMAESPFRVVKIDDHAPSSRCHSASLQNHASQKSHLEFSRAFFFT